MRVVPADRQVLACEIGRSSLEPGNYHSVERRVVTEMSQATLVSSSLTAVHSSWDAHAPCLDIDIPSALTVDGRGRCTLWVDGIDPDQWVLSRAALTAAGLWDQSRYADVGPTQGRLEALAAQEAHFDSVSVGAAMRAVGPGTDGPFSDLLATVLACCDTGHSSGMPVTPRPPTTLSDPWPLPLMGPALLLPSTSNHHLYVETAMASDAYMRLLWALRNCGWVEPGYISASIQRRATHLRLPWVAKSNDPEKKLLLVA